MGTTTKRIVLAPAPGPSCCAPGQRKRGVRCASTDVSSRLTAEEARGLTADLEALAHPVRLQLLDILSRNGGQVCVCDLEAALPVKQPTVSHHLKLLVEAGLVDYERHGLWSYYFVRKGALAALRERVASRLSSLV